MPAVPTNWVWPYGQPGFSVEEAAVSVNNGNGTFGTPVRIPGITTVDVDLKTVSDQAQGDTQIVATAAQLISVDVTIKFPGIVPDVMAIIAGITPSTSVAAGGQPNRTFMTYANQRMPYFALIFDVLGAEDAGDMIGFLPRIKIMQGFPWSWTFGKINTPSLKAMAILDRSLGYMFQAIDRDAFAALVVPPV